MILAAYRVDLQILRIIACREALAGAGQLELEDRVLTAAFPQQLEDLRFLVDLVMATESLLVAVDDSRHRAHSLAEAADLDVRCRSLSRCLYLPMVISLMMSLSWPLDGSGVRRTASSLSCWSWIRMNRLAPGA